jgi:hypothetical protein
MKVNIPTDYDMNPSEKMVFPCNDLPGNFAEIIRSTKDCLNYPIDYTGTSLLGAVATAIGKGAKLRVKSDWFEYPALYLSIVGGAGASKSHPLSFAFNPLTRIDKAAIDKYANEMNEYEEKAQMAKQARKGTVVKLPKKPILEKMVMNDFTPEILFQRLAENPRGCAVVSDELATFLDGMNNYSKGDRASMYLSFWSNKSISVDRIKNPVPIWVEDPHIVIIGSLQPRVLPKLFPTDKTDNGFLQRFLFAYPDGVEKTPINDNQLPEQIKVGYADWINDCMKALQPGEGLRLFKWTAPAKDFFYSWQAENTKWVNKNQHSIWGEILSKFDIQFCRLSLILQVMENCHTSEIGLKAVEGAAQLCRYYIHSAMKVLECLNNANPSDTLPENKKAFYDALNPDFSTNEAISIGEQYGVGPKSVQRLLTNQTLFTKLLHGRYSKVVKI